MLWLLLFVCMPFCHFVKNIYSHIHPDSKIALHLLKRSSQNVGRTMTGLEFIHAPTWDIHASSILSKMIWHGRRKVELQTNDDTDRACTVSEIRACRPKSSFVACSIAHVVKQESSRWMPSKAVRLYSPCLPFSHFFKYFLIKCITVHHRIAHDCTSFLYLFHSFRVVSLPLLWGTWMEWMSSWTFSCHWWMSCSRCSCQAAFDSQSGEKWQHLSLSHKMSQNVRSLGWLHDFIDFIILLNNTSMIRYFAKKKSSILVAADQLLSLSSFTRERFIFNASRSGVFPAWWALEDSRPATSRLVRLRTKLRNRTRCASDL